MAQSRILTETNTNSKKTGYSIRVRGIEIDTTIPGGQIDGRLLVGNFEANNSGITVFKIYANNSLGSSGQVLKTNGNTVYWGTGTGSGGSSTAYYLTANARSDLANTNTYIASKSSWTSLLNTNTALRLLIADRLQVSNAAATYVTKINPTTSALWTHTGRATISTNLDVTGNTSSNKLNVTNWLKSSGNTFIGASGKTSVVTGVLQANGRVTVSTNLSVTGNTSSNKLSVTNRLESYGNNILGSAGKTNILNGNVTGNGNFTISKNVVISGNTTLHNRLNAPNRVVLSRDTSLQSWLSCAGTNAESNNNAGAFMTITSDGTTGAPTTVNIRAGGANKISTTSTTITITGVLAVTGRQTISTNLAVTGNISGNKLNVTNWLKSSGNTFIGASGKTSVVTGVLTANGRVTISTNLDVTGNTSSNKLNVTNWFKSSGNTFIGASGKTSVVTGVLQANGRATVSTNLSVTGNTSSNKLSVTSNIDGTNANTRVLALGVGTTPGTNGSIRATNDITAYYSDERLKDIIEIIPSPIEKIMSLRGFYFTPNKIAQDLGYSYKKEVGVSAQEVQAVLPEIVVPAPIDEQYLTVKYEKLIPLLIEAIKELKNEIEELKRSKSI